MSLGRKSLLAAAICLTPALALTASPAAFALPSVDTTGAVSSGDNWAITPVAGGYEVTLDLAEPLPIVADAPTLLVDGVDVGYAVESSDGLSLSAFTTDPSVADAENVTKGWSSGTDKAEEGEVPSAEPATTDEKSLAKKLDAFSDANLAAVSEDPSAPGDYTVNEVEYDFGNEAIALPNIGGVRGEMTGKMYLTDAPGARPTVILMHGRHSSCATPTGSGGAANPVRWPCGDAATNRGRSQVNIRSYLGYEGTGRALASHGYNVLSIAVNSINSNDNQLAPDYGANARGATVIETLEMLKKANAGQAVSYDDITAYAAEVKNQAGVVTAPAIESVKTTRTLDEAITFAATRADAPGAAPATPVSAASLVGRFDLTNVGVMGHSRGGEGATAAATLNLGLDEPFGINAVLPLAPVDFGRMTVPNVPMAVFLPYCDGDVSNQQGQHMFDDSRGAFDDNVLRSAVWIMGTNHNFFNTVWTPGLYPYGASDDWSTSDTTSTCSTRNTTRLTAAQQYQVGVSYMTGFFRLTLGGDTQFQELFDGTVKPATPSTEGFGDVRIIASQPHNTTSMIADFTEQNSLIRTYGTATAPVCMNMNGITIPQSVPLCTTTKASGASPHYAIMRFGGNVPANPLTKLTWTSGTGELRVTLPKEKRDVSGYSQLTLRTAPEETVPTGTDFTIRLVDGNGATYSTLASAINPLAVNRLPGGTNTTLNKVVLQQLTIPTASITGVNLSDIREVRFIAAVGADTTATGGVYLSDLAFSNPALGTAVTTTHTAVNLTSTSVDEGSGPGTAELAVSLTRADTVPVTAYVSSVGAATGRAGIGMEKVVFAPGETCKTIEVPILGDTVTSTTTSTAVVIAATNTQNAVMGANAFGYLTVREDDGITNGSALSPAVGAQGDACAEAAVAKTTGALSLSSTDLAPGAVVTVSGTGYRTGESVLFTDGSLDLGRATADSTGAVSKEITLAGDAVLGTHTFKAVGAGYGYTSTTEASVLADTETALTLDPEVPAIKEPVTLKATVTGSSTAGVVTFTDGETELGTADTVEGVATLELPDGFAAGEHTVSAAFGATDTARGSASESVSFTLEKGATTVALTLGAANTTFGTGTTATATIEGAAEGVVSFGYGDTVVEVEAVEGVATLEIPATLKAGAYTVTATYLGTDTIAESAPATAAYTVAKKSTSTTLKLAKTTVKANGTVTGTVTVKGAVAGINPTGTVKIYSGSTVIREMKLSTASNGSIKISFKAPSSKGSITTKVTFVGDGNYAASSSARYSVKITK